jgi:F-type H+-transporting ATPase subunit delta
VALEGALDQALTQGVDRGALAEDLFAIVEVVDGSATLRRALADPSRPSEDKRALVGSLLAKAEGESRIDDVEDQLFRFERIVAGDAGLRDTLSMRNTDAKGKSGLVRSLLEGKVHPETLRLAEQAVSVPRGRRLDRSMGEYLALASRRRDELTAQVTVARPLDEQQAARLRSALESIYGKAVKLQVVIDESVLGGIRVQIGDEVVDGTILRRLDEARRHVTGS